MAWRSGWSIVLVAAAIACAADDPGNKTPTWPQQTKLRNAEMKRRVDAWLAEGQDAAMPLHVVYLSCEDQEPFAGYRERLDRVLTEMQVWLADQHEAAGFGRTTVSLDRDDGGRVRMHMGKLPFTVDSRTSRNKTETKDATEQAARALLAEAGFEYGRSFVLILTTIPDDHGAAPFFGVRIQNRGVCWAVDTPWLDTEYTKTDGPRVWKGKPVGPANSALIGGIVHELGHGLGLPHSDEPDAERSFGESLMAGGNYTWRESRRGSNRDTYLLDTDAMFLMARPPFAGRVRDFDRQPRAKVRGVEVSVGDDGRVTVSGRVESDVPAYAVKVYDDPPDNDDYNAVAHAALPDEQTGAFSITYKPIAAAGPHGLVLYVYHVNGRWTERRAMISVAADGKADVTGAKGLLEK